MEMNGKITELIAIGASITANCQPCLQIHVERAVKSGATREEVASAIEIGTRVRKGAAAKMETFSAQVRGTVPQIEMGAVMEGNGCQFLGP